LPIELSIDAALAGRVRIGAAVIDGVTVQPGDAALTADIETHARELRERHGSARSGEVPGAAAARSLYKALGLDPTKTRPSNEALLRRVLKGESLYVVNTLVDALNLCSLHYQLPFGLYDHARILPPVVLRKGRAGESYEGIRKGAVHVEGRPVLVDAQGPFGNPTSDSARTMITLETRVALVVLYAPANTPAARLQEVMAGTEATLTRFCGGAVASRLCL
jgi:DNA/RNA-binding domain of Phe-tRNA-synthetase-like protein